MSGRRGRPAAGAHGVAQALIVDHQPAKRRVTPEFNHLAEPTKKDKREHLDRAREDLGALEARGARKLLIDWRDGMAKTPKTADDRLSDLSGVLTWAHDKGEIAATR